MRLIDADKLKKHYAWWGAESASEEMKENKKIFDTIIDLQPTVEAEPIRHSCVKDNGRCLMCDSPIPTDSGLDYIARNEVRYCYFCGRWTERRTKNDSL